ncbi:2659_t:CDS:2 [Diversispora eburnea]|uniref:Chitobiosyldiphosphodolichol beta-mannosyltransferase n=1 Tax=Diversispora eburnea TaxID=1213867 RepID=A0A9N9GFC8_9GLOM|nr:2659_t:CDS:2 [Diversispora eburnea]
MYITEITEEKGIISISETKLLIVLICLVVFVRGFSLYIQKNLLKVQQPIKKNVTIVVMGDIGRSPRMQYHALSFAQNGWKVDFIGYDGSKPLESISSNPNIKIHYITHPWRISDRSSKLLFILYAPIKIYIQIIKLYWYLIMRINSPDFILVQNPPSIPILMIVQFICWLRQTNLIIDWHNFGYTILGLRLGQDNFMVKFAKWYEKLYGGRAHAHLTVTAAMHRELMYNWEFLTRVNLEKLVTEQTLDSNFLPSPTTSTTNSSSTLLTTKSSSTSSAKYRTNRPILIVSSTSWTADEDFSILLKAIKIYDQYVENNNKSFPKLLFVITGNGPLKDKYIKDISSADLGICLHTSSSGMDLPMKVVDMFGCGLPVLAIGFNCLDELIKHNKNGLIFKNEEQLTMGYKLE